MSGDKPNTPKDGQQVGVVLKGDMEHYKYEAAIDSGRLFDQSFARDVEDLGWANHFARTIREELSHGFNRASKGRLIENSSAIDQALDNVTSHLSRPEASAFRQEFMRHHDLIEQRNDRGDRFYATDPDAKTARSGDLVVSTKFFTPGNQF